MFGVSVAFDKRLDKCHHGVIPLCHLLFTTVPFKLLLHDLLLSVLFQVNGLGGGVAFFLLVGNVRTI